MPTSEPVHQAPMGSAQGMLLDFLREHDAACPVCGYNLKALPRPICPECRQDLVLTVGVGRLRLGWLLAALAPGFFCGFAACFVLLPTVGIYLDDGVFFPPFVGAVLFGWCSGLFALALVLRANRFIARSRGRQRWFTIAIWLTHAGAFVLFLLSLAPHI